MPTLVATAGLPASGKSTWARAWVAQDPARRARVNRDDLRRMLHGRRLGTAIQEEQVTAAQTAAVRALLGAGTNVVVDDTNLEPEHLDALRRLAAEVGVDFRVKSFRPVPPEECIRRDAARPADQRVGEQVIREMAAEAGIRFARTRSAAGRGTRRERGTAMINGMGTLQALWGRLPDWAWSATADEDITEVVAEFLTQVRDGWASPEQVAEWIAAGGRWWDTPPDEAEQARLAEHRAELAERGVDLDSLTELQIRLGWRRLDGTETGPRYREASRWDDAARIMEPLAPLAPGQDVWDAAHTMVASGALDPYGATEPIRQDVVNQMTDLRRDLFAAAVAVEHVAVTAADVATLAGEVPAGPLRRLAATTARLTREDGQTELAFGPATEVDKRPGVGVDEVVTRLPVQWWSYGSCWRHGAAARCWHIAAELTITVDPEYGDTRMGIAEVVITAVGGSAPLDPVESPPQRRHPAVTVFRGAPDQPGGDPLAGVIREELLAALARQQLRHIVGVPLLHARTEPDADPAPWSPALFAADWATKGWR